MIPKTGGLKLNAYRYRKLRKEKYKAQGESCADCGQYTEFWNWELHHIDGRGLGGGRRDDARTIGLCSQCHRKYDERPAWSLK